MEKVIKPAVNEIKKLDKSFEDFKCEPLYSNKRGKPLSGYKFTWKPEIRHSKEVKKSPKKSKKQNSFNNFTQREYDFDDLEKKLLAFH